MKFKIYVYQKRYDQEFISWGSYTYYTTPYNYFYSYLEKHNLLQYLNKDRQVSHYLYGANDIDDRSHPRLMIFKVPFKKRKEFKQDWFKFIREREIEKGFFIK